MSDYAEGPGWWQASDDKWYPPEQAPGPDPVTGAAWPAPTQPSAWGAPPSPGYGAPTAGAPSYGGPSYGVAPGAGYAPQGGYAYGGSGLPSVSGQATASMVLGIVALVLFLCWFLSIGLALVGLPLGLVALNKINKGDAAPDGKGMALAGVILSGIALLLALGFAALVFAS